MFAVYPRNDCPHVQDLKITETIPKDFLLVPCQECKDRSENWVCVKCMKVYCGRFVNGHMKKHFEMENDHSIVFGFRDLSFWCYKCASYIVDPQLKPFYDLFHQQKFNISPQSLQNFFFVDEKKDFELVKILKEEVFSLCKPLQAGIDKLSKRHAMKNLQKLLEEKFGRKVGKYDLHGVKNFSIDKNVFDLPDDDVVRFGCYKTTGKRLKKQGNSFRIFYIDKISTSENIKNHFVDKKESRKWNQIFDKHFYISTSEVDIIYDEKGDPLNVDCSSEEFQSKKVILVTAVGFDCSAHRLTGVHFGDFMRILKRKDGKEIVPKKEKEKINPNSTDLWKDAYHYWLKLLYYPKKIYLLDEKIMLEDYKIQFSLIFSALKSQGIEVPVVSAIGCGVFGNKFSPEYQMVVINAYLEVLSQNDYGFKGVVLCEVNPNNVEIFRKEIGNFGGKIKIPFVIAQNDILVVSRLISRKYSTSILNAGDLWEFGQFWEGGGALEEYCARMTSGYLSQHYLLNPKVIDSSRYIKMDVNELGIEVDKDYVENLEKFIKTIKEDFLG